MIFTGPNRQSQICPQCHIIYMHYYFDEKTRKEYYKCHICRYTTEVKKTVIHATAVNTKD